MLEPSMISWRVEAPVTQRHSARAHRKWSSSMIRMDCAVARSDLSASPHKSLLNFLFRNWIISSESPMVVPSIWIQGVFPFGPNGFLVSISYGIPAILKYVSNLRTKGEMLGHVLPRSTLCRINFGAASLAGSTEFGESTIFRQSRIGCNRD